MGEFGIRSCFWVRRTGTNLGRQLESPGTVSGCLRPTGDWREGGEREVLGRRNVIAILKMYFDVKLNAIKIDLSCECGGKFFTLNLKMKTET